MSTEVSIIFPNQLYKEHPAIHNNRPIEAQNRIALLIDNLHAHKVKHIHIVDPVDNWLLENIKSSCKQHGIELIIYNCPNFLNSLNEVDAYFSKKKTYFQTDFYTSQRKYRNMLLEKDGKPLGGKWTYDADNRSKFPKKEVVPA